MRTTKTSFAGGEFSPALQARADLAKYETGLRLAKNVFVHPHGGVSNRAGFEVISYLPEVNTLTVQIPFVVNRTTQETYILLMGPERMWITRDGAPVVEGFELFNVSDSGGEALFTAHSITTPHGYSNGDFVVYTLPEAPALNGRTFEVREVSGQTLKLWDIANRRTVYFGEADLTEHPTAAEARLHRRYEIATPYGASDLREITFAQDNDVMYLAHPAHQPRKITRNGDTDWTLGLVSYGAGRGSIRATVATTHGTGYTGPQARQANYRVVADGAAVSASTGASNALNLPGAKNTISWTLAGPVGITKFSIYKDAGTGIFGFIGEVSATTNSFVDDNITPGHGRHAPDIHQPVQRRRQVPPGRVDPRAAPRVGVVEGPSRTRSISARRPGSSRWACRGRCARTRPSRCGCATSRHRPSTPLCPPRRGSRSSARQASSS